MAMEKIQHDFAWGDTRGIRKIMVNELQRIGLNLIGQNLEQFGYPAHEGEPALIAEIKRLIKNLTGKEYKNVLVTNGATHALNAFIYAVKNDKITGLATRNLYFPFYPQIAALHKLKHELYRPNLDGYLRPEHIGIVDSPSNPEGLMTNKGHLERVVWDASYYSPTYCGIEKGGRLVCPEIVPLHAAMAGSLNKLTGINGLRIGWLATDNHRIYEEAKYYVESDLCGVSGPSQEYATRILQRVDLHAFYCESKRLLDNNREELQRLSYLFGNQPIFPCGMFALFEVDAGIRSLFRRAGVKFKDGNEIGDKERDSVRINLANSNEATKAMVEAILKADKT